MAIGSNNPFPSVLILEGSAPSSPSAGNQRVFIDSADHLLKYKSSGGVVSNASGLIGYKVDASSGNHTTTTGTLVDADATNLAITFTAPLSTNVLVRLTGLMRTNAASGERVLWGLRESSTVIGGGDSAGFYVGFANGSLIVEARSVVFVKTGISAGSHTYKWAIGCTASSGGLTADASDPATMEVWALP